MNNCHRTLVAFLWAFYLHAQKVTDLWPTPTLMELSLTINIVVVTWTSDLNQ